MLVLENVSRSFGPRAVLRGVSLVVRRGEVVAIMGESGSGKSTLLNIAAGLERPDSGRVEVDGQELTRLDDDAATLLRRRRIGFVFQAFHLLPYLSVEANVALPLLLNGVDDATARGKVAAMLEAVGLAGDAKRKPSQLSGGEMQRVAIARALVHEPALVLADEPTGNLDQAAATQVLALLHERTKAHGAAGILVTHSLAAARTADRIELLSEAGLAPLVA